MGTLAREAGDIQKALAMHREAVALAPSPDVRDGRTARILRSTTRRRLTTRVRSPLRVKH